ncbi:MAG TPA: MoaD/ThiS family protein [Anaerolineae bacterium]|nr:MoaD/ThiS family protein [Anaerolineae bacterium]HQI87182.1 MoaD/ThiS family protein [Anaerolineae bacterium]
MQIQVEFTGIPRIVTGVKQVPLEFQDGTTFREIVRYLGTRYPKMVGEVLQPDGETLQPSNMLNLNGRRMIQPTQMDDGPSNGDRLILMSILAGG